MSRCISTFLFPKAEIKPCPWTTSALWDQYSQTENAMRWDFWPAVILVHHFKCSIFKSHQRFNPQEKHFLQPSLRETAALCPCTLLEPHFTENIMRANHSNFVPVTCEHAWSWSIHTKIWKLTYMWKTVNFLLGLSSFILTILNQNSWFQGILQDSVLFLQCQKFQN